MVKSGILVAMFLLATSGICLAQGEKPLLLQKPTISKASIVFAFAGNLWIVGRDGGEAKRLTTGGFETDPVFSPDGSMIAFTGEYDGNQDVFVIPASGGVPKRLTYHPAPDNVVGWTPDGKHILFRSARGSANPVPKLFTISVDGGFPSEVPLPMAVEGSYSADGARLAYVPTVQWQAAWKRYHGGQTTPIWVANMADSRIVERIPRDNSNDSSPMWIGNRIYFLSDRSGAVTLFSYDTGSKKVSQVVKNDGLDIKSASAGPGAIVYEQFGSLHRLDLASGQSTPLRITLEGDLPEVRAHYIPVGNRIAEGKLSPTGTRAVFEAHGDIFTAPAEKGDVRNLTASSAVADRDPAWSPDGKWIAYFSDESGEYELHLRDQTGLGQVRKINLGNPPSFFYSPAWSPDSKKIAYTDKRLNLWYVDLDKGTPTKVDSDTYDSPFRVIDPAWSPDSRWIGYTRQLKSHLCAVFVHSLETGKNHQITDGLSDARFAVFDKSGKYLYFTASTDSGPTAGWLDMSSINRPVTRSIYVVVLRDDLPSPLAPESDEEKAPDVKPDAKPDAKAEEAKAAASKEPTPVRIDFDNISQRILALPAPPRNYAGLIPGKAGTLFILEGGPIPAGFGPPAQSLSKFDLTTRKLDKVAEGVASIDISSNGEKMLYRQGPAWFIVGTAQPPKPGEGALKLDGMQVYVDPRAEWKQIYNEVWRIERDFLYDPGLHGLDLKATEQRYRPYLDSIYSRGDLNYLFTEMLGELTVGHMFVGGGDAPEPKRVSGGLLGADYKVENGRYRLARVYNGENWNPGLHAPLTQPGVKVAAGEYLLAVRGRELRGSDNIYSFFEETAGKSTVIRVGPDPSGSGARDVTVVPVDNEGGLRNLAWIEDNRRKVDQLSGGRLAYVYLPDTGGAGYTNFNRYYFAQVGRDGAVIDERFNGGGLIADYIIDYMRRPQMAFFTSREGEDYQTPVGSIYGPKAMIINEFAGSGGDAMPWMFRQAGIGPLVGKRTWGGLVGIFGYPVLIDGGSVTAPRAAFYNLKGEWDVENHGVPPDVEVEFDPAAWRTGHDIQLEKAVEVVLAELKKNPRPKYKKPAYPNYHTPLANPAGRGTN
jgi:tricorn protease